LDEQEHAGGAEPLPPPADGATAPLPDAAGASQSRRGATARRALTSRAAGWVVAAVLAGIIIGLLVGFARSSPAVSVAQAGPARFSIGAAALPPGAMAGLGGGQRQIVTGPAGVSRQIILPAALAPGAVIVGPAGAPGKVAACPPGVATGPVRVFLPAVPARVSWRFVQLPAAAGAQLPASWAVPQMLPPVAATVHAQRVAAGAQVQLVPPGQLGARLRIVAPGHVQITLPGRGITVCPSGR
jgi:hypothetical protein